MLAEFLFSSAEYQLIRFADPRVFFPLAARLKEGARKINAGLSIVMFPEATRISVDKNVKFKASAAKLALNTGVPIVLIAHNAGLVWPKGFWFARPGTVKVKIIEQMLPKQIAKYDVRELTAYIQEKVNSEKNELARLGV